MSAGPRGPTEGPLAPDSAQRTLAHLVKECREVVDAKGPERLCHIWSEDLRRLCDALEAGAAARRAPTDAMIDAAFRSVHGYVNAPGARGLTENRQRASIAEALRAALAAPEGTP